jgi:hypothetical protein
MYGRYRMRIPTPAKPPPPSTSTTQDFLVTLGLHIIAHLAVCRLIQYYLEFFGITCATRCYEVGIQA